MRGTFSHDNFGDTARVELCDNEVAIVFVADTDAKARELADQMLEQLRGGKLHLTLTGEPVAQIGSFDGDD